MLFYLEILPDVPPEFCPALPLRALYSSTHCLYLVTFISDRVLK